jgi:hypothetical protein
MPNRIEREIEEILTRLDEFVPEEKRSRRLKRSAGSAWRNVGDRVRGALRGISGGHVLLGAAALLLLGLFLQGPFPTLSRWAMVVALVIFFGAIFLSIRGPRRQRTVRYWRDQPIELRRPNPFMRLRMWWRRRNRG